MRISNLEEYLEYVKGLGREVLGTAFSDQVGEQGSEGTVGLIARERELHQEAAGFLEEEGFLPLEYLFQLFECGDFQRHCILMALCYELDVLFAEECVRLAGDGHGRGLTPYLARLTWPRDMADGEVREALHPASVFIRVFFRRISGEYPEMGRPLVLAERVLDVIFGRLEENERLKPYMRRYTPEGAMRPLKEGQPHVAAFLGRGKNVVELTGEPGTGRRYCARYYCNHTEKTAYFISASHLLWQQADGFLLEEICRECCIFQAVPIIVFSEEEDGETGDRIFFLIRQLLEVVDLVFVVNRRSLFRKEDTEGNGEQWLSFTVRDMSLTEKRKAWKEEGEKYRLAQGVSVEEMANLFPLTYGGIRKALERAAWQAKKQGRGEIGREDMRKGCYSLFQLNLRDKAVRVPAVYGWEDLVLPSHQRELLATACNQVRYRHYVYENWGFGPKLPYGRGVSMIFAGAPGTGKTMAAQVFAGELGIDLYKIELSAVVSKFVGETEKNLKFIFDEAGRSRVILFFDEADVLFGKRTEVKDANDKYSNMEAAFLLQKMEEYEGVTILSTNLIQNFDEAFKRRVKFVIDFPFPDKRDRRRLWEKAIPPEMEREELDVEYLAERFELSGSNIKNVALHAAFLAAAAGKPVDMRHILMGIRNEYAKSGKTLTKKDVGEYYVYLPELRS